jgi:AraC family transcriptional regulator
MTESGIIVSYRISCGQACMVGRCGRPVKQGHKAFAPKNAQLLFSGYRYSDDAWSYINESPMKTTTRQSYAARIERAQQYLLEHLDDAINLEQIAATAHFSPYHFHRVYVSMVGETVAETMRRNRLNRAAVKLLTSATPVVKLGHEAGYSRVQAFNRAFRDAYGVTPTAYRVHGSLAVALQVKRSQHTHPKESIMREVTIQNVEPMRVVALRHQGDYMDIGNTFERLGAWAAGKNLCDAGTRSFGIYYDDPDSKPVAELKADACMTVAQAFKPEAPYTVTRTPGGRCAQMIHTGPYSELIHAYRWLYTEWLPKSGEEPGDQPPFEEYLNDPRTTPPAQLQTAIRIPLRGG